MGLFPHRPSPSLLPSPSQWLVQPALSPTFLSPLSLPSRPAGPATTSWPYSDFNLDGSSSRKPSLNSPYPPPSPRQPAQEPPAPTVPWTSSLCILLSNMVAASSMWLFKFNLNSLKLKSTDNPVPQWHQPCFKGPTGTCGDHTERHRYRTFPSLQKVSSSEHCSRTFHSLIIIIGLFLFSLPWMSTVSGAGMPGFESRLH